MDTNTSTLRVAAVGDAVVTRRLRTIRDPAFTALVERLRQADGAFANVEFVVPDLPATPSSKNIAIRFAAPPYVLDELAWAGFNLFNVANNHSDDYSIQGLLDTMQQLDARDMVHAGGGRDLHQARLPRYLDTPKGRIGLVAATSSGAKLSLASNGRGFVAARPGVNPLRFRTEYRVRPSDLAQLRRIDESLGTAAARRFVENLGIFPHALPGRDQSEVLRFLGNVFVATEGEPHVATIPLEEDVEAISAWVSDASRQCDFVMVSLHCHESAGNGWNMELPADFIGEACRRFVEAGADVVFGHGPHRLRGIEIHGGRPIFYSLGNFLFMDDTLELVGPEVLADSRLPRDGTPGDLHDFRERREDGTPRGFHQHSVWWESVLVELEATGERSWQAMLTPVGIPHEGPRAQRGAPQRLTGDKGRAVLERLAAMSAEQHGTDVKILGNDEEVHGLLVGP